MFRNTLALRSLFICGHLVGLSLIPAAVAHADTDGKAPMTDIATYVDPSELQADDGATMTTDEIAAAVRDKAGRPKESVFQQVQVDTIDGEPLAPGKGDVVSVDGAGGSAVLGGAEPDANEYDVGHGSIYPRWDDDWWYFYADGGENLTLTMDRTSGSLDSFLVLYDPSGRLVAIDDDSNGNLNARISTVLPHARGNYTVLAKSWNGQSSGGYVITELLRESTRTGSRPCSSGNVLTPGEVRRGYISDGAPSNTHCFSGYRGEWFTIRMSATGGVGFYPGGLDTLLKVHLTNGRVLRDDDGGIDRNSMLTVQLPASSWFAIEATRYSGTGDYLITVERGRKGHPADVNSDGCVNTMDLTRIYSTVGNGRGDRGYDPNADVDLNGFVNTIDVSEAEGAYGVCG